MKNAPDSIQAIIDLITTPATPIAIEDVGGFGTFTGVTMAKANDPGFEIGMFIEFDGFPLRRQITGINKTTTTTQFIFVTYPAIEGLTPDVNILLNYYYGNPKEIHSRIIEMSKDTDQKRKKFPLLALFLDVEEDRGGNAQYDFEAKLNMALIIDANKHWKPDDRLTTSFKLTLYPLYELFIKKCQSKLGTNEYNRIKHQKTDRYFYSADKAADQNTIAAFVDAIEITDFELKTFKC